LRVGCSPTRAIFDVARAEDDAFRCLSGSQDALRPHALFTKRCRQHATGTEREQKYSLQEVRVPLKLARSYGLNALQMEGASPAGTCRQVLESMRVSWGCWGRVDNCGTVTECSTRLRHRPTSVAGNDAANAAQAGRKPGPETIQHRQAGRRGRRGPQCWQCEKHTSALPDGGRFLTGTEWRRDQLNVDAHELGKG